MRMQPYNKIKKFLINRYRLLLLFFFPQSPSVIIFYPGIPIVPWHKKYSIEELAKWYGIEPYVDYYGELFLKGEENENNDSLYRQY